MKVSELIEYLQQLDPDRIVVMARDSEGNGFNEMNHLYTCTYGDGGTFIEALTPELEEQGYSEEDVYQGDDGQPAVSLWP
jgi:hypothetical protein